MAGMEGLGRLVDVVPIAAGQAFKFRGASAVLFVCTAADTFTITASSSFGGSYATPGNIISHFYQRADTNATHAWTLQTQAASNAVVQANAGYTTAFEVLTSMFADPNDYIKVSVGGSGLVTAILHDLTVQRKPANLEILGA
jgi:threonine dehydratase